MKPEDLLVLASARGIRLDLGERRDLSMAHMGSPKRRDVRPKTADDPGDPGIPGVFGALGKQDRPTKEPVWSGKDLALAAAGMPEVYWRALCWCIAVEPVARAYLNIRLMDIAVDLRQREQWPATFRRGQCEQTGLARDQRDYLQDLCTLALREAADPQVYGNELARATWFGLSESHWRRAIARGYQGIYRHLDGWYVSALGYLKYRLQAIDDGAEPTTKNQRVIANERRAGHSP